MLSSLEFREGTDANAIQAWLQDEPMGLVDELDPDELWSRPVTAACLHAFPEKMSTLLSDAEPWRRGSLLELRHIMIYDNVECIGFSTLLLVQRPDSDVNGCCRYCYEGSDFGELVEGCACRGFLRHIHASCLLQDYKLNGRTTCSVCKQQYTGKALSVLHGMGKRNIEKKEDELKARVDKDVDQLERLQILKDQVQVATQAWQTGKLTEASQSFHKALEIATGVIPESDLTMLTAHHNLALVLQDLGKFTAAATHMNKARIGFATALGENSPLTLKALHNEALIAQRRERFQEALDTYRRVLSTRREVLGDRHIDTLKTWSNVGLVLYKLNRLSEAESELRQTLDHLQTLLGAEHYLTLISMQNLSLVLSDQNPTSEQAVKLGREAAEGKMNALGPQNHMTWEGWRDLAKVSNAAGYREEAERLWRQALKGQQEVFGTDHAVPLSTLTELKKALQAWGRSEEANKLDKDYRVSDVKAAPLPPKKGPVIAVLLQLYVIPRHRRRGVGRATMEHWRAALKASAAIALQAWLVLPESGACRQELLDFFQRAASIEQVGERISASGNKRYVHLHCDL